MTWEPFLVNEEHGKELEMAVFHPDNLNVPKAEYWWKESESCLSAISKLIKVDDCPEIRSIVCDKCHGMLERAAKAMISEQGNFTEKDRTHNLKHLFKKAGLFQKLSTVEQAFVSEVSNLHYSCSYPDDRCEVELWYDDMCYQRIILQSIRLYTAMKKGDFENEGGEQNGSNRAC